MLLQKAHYDIFYVNCFFVTCLNMVLCLFGAWLMVDMPTVWVQGHGHGLTAPPLQRHPQRPQIPLQEGRKLFFTKIMDFGSETLSFIKPFYSYSKCNGIVKLNQKFGAVKISSSILANCPSMCHFRSNAHFFMNDIDK